MTNVKQHRRVSVQYMHSIRICEYVRVPRQSSSSRANYTQQRNTQTLHMSLTTPTSWLYTLILHTRGQDNKQTSCGGFLGSKTRVGAKAITHRRTLLFVISAAYNWPTEMARVAAN